MRTTKGIRVKVYYWPHLGIQYKITWRGVALQREYASFLPSDGPLTRARELCSMKRVKLAGLFGTGTGCTIYQHTASVFVLAESTSSA